jgi:DNA-binding FadR family transcriptional regulator
MSISNPWREEWGDIGALEADGEDSAATLPTRIERRISDLIESGELGAGARLPSERELARIFAVSRLAVREAAHRLEARGLVVVRRGAGSFVAARRTAADLVPPQPQSTGNLDELAEVMLLLEPAAADWAARRADRSSRAVLVRVADQFAQAAREPAPRFDLLGDADTELHVEIARAADNAQLAHLIELLHRSHGVRLEWGLRRPGRLAQTVSEHRRVVDAIAAADPAGAREAMVAHLHATAGSLHPPADDAVD